MSDTKLNEIPRMPKFLTLLAFVEMWERFSYYGMRAILVLYLVSELGFADERAYITYSLFAALAYAGPVLSGYIADRWLGFRSMVVIGASTMLIGHITMGLTVFYNDMIFLGLSLIAVGTSMFKGNITNLLGVCYTECNRGRERGFTIFYISVNLGSFLASLSCAYISYFYGWHYGFGLAGVGMLFGLVAFIKFKYILGENGIAPNPDLVAKNLFFGLKLPHLVFILGLISAYLISFMFEIASEFVNFLQFFGIVIFTIFFVIIIRSKSEQRNNLIVLSLLTIFMMCFFAIEMQLGSLINLFAKRNIVDQVLGFHVPAAVSQSLNPLSIIILGGIISKFFQFKSNSSTMRFAIGISTMSFCFMILYFGCLNADSNGRVEYIYLIIGMFFMGLGELLIAPFVIAQCTLLAPKNLRGFMMGLVMLALAFSNLGGIYIAQIASVPTLDGNADSLISLEIYKSTFLRIAEFNFYLLLIFMLFYQFINKVIVKNSKKVK